MDIDPFSKPDSFDFAPKDSFINDAGHNIRWGHAKPDGEIRGRIVILGGFREPIEKYFEVMNEKLAQGYEIYAMDWPGQGGSDRFLPGEPMKSHHLGYAESIATLDKFMREKVQAAEKNSPDASGVPLFIIAHSMGGHLALRYLKECENTVTAAAISAPMIDFETGRFGPFLAKTIIGGAKMFHALTKYIPFGKPWTEKADGFEGNRKTSDRKRSQIQTDIYRNNPKTQMGDPTCGWVYESRKSVETLNNEEYLSAIKTPIIMEISGNEKIVKRSAIESAATWLSNCIRVDIAEALHEIWMERDELRDKWRTAVDDFMEAHIREFSLRREKNRKAAPRGPQP